MSGIKSTFQRPALVFAVAAACLWHAAPALATSAVAPNAIPVPLQPAELHDGQGGKMARDRIAAAARQVCGLHAASLQEQMIARSCYLKAVRDGEAKLAVMLRGAKAGQPALAAAN